MTMQISMNTGSRTKNSIQERAIYNRCTRWVWVRESSYERNKRSKINKSTNRAINFKFVWIVKSGLHSVFVRSERRRHVEEFSFFFETNIFSRNNDNMWLKFEISNEPFKDCLFHWLFLDMCVICKKIFLFSFTCFFVGVLDACLPLSAASFGVSLWHFVMFISCQLPSLSQRREILSERVNQHFQIFRMYCIVRTEAYRFDDWVEKHLLGELKKQR